MTGKQGPLTGLRVVEFLGIGPGPVCGMMLADLGAEVLVIDRVTPSTLGVPRPPRFEVARRGKAYLALDLKDKADIALALDLIAGADALVEGFRPGTMERLGLGPDECLARNPKLIFARITGWGQEGPLAATAGHDLNYIALTGVLAGIGRKGGAPTPPLNLVGDYAGGAMLAAFGILAALQERTRSGRGQVVDAAMVDGVATLFAEFFGFAAAGFYNGERGSNLLDSGAPQYDVYVCADGQWLSVAPIEDKFRAVMLERLGLAPEAFPDVRNPANWEAGKQILSDIFRTKPRDAWVALFAGTDACVAPVLSMAEAPQHPHAQARQSYLNHDGLTHAAPSPRFSRTPGAIDFSDEKQRTTATLREWPLAEAVCAVCLSRVQG
ncbi:MAG: CaiB/BaiF CoA transferase family protein [Beijerinckiaceae bacterium]